MIFSILAFFTISASGVMAMMGGSHHHEGGANYEGQMGGSSGHNDGQSFKAYSGGPRTGMSPPAAENLIRNYMKEKSDKPYNLGRIDDSGSYYLTDILAQDGSVMDRVIIDKYTGQVRSIP